MAKWRALYTSIVTDEAIIELTDADQLLYERMVVKADDWGVITGNIKALKIETIPVSSRNFQEIDDALQEMEGLALIWRYQPEGRGPLVQIRKFDEHQPGELIRKRTDPKLPLHPDWRPIEGDERGSRIFQEMSGNSEKFLARVDKSRVEESRGEESSGDDDRKPYSQIFTDETGVLVGTAQQAEEMDAFMEDIPEEWFRAACKAGVDNNVRRWSYVRKICTRCRDDGVAPGEGKHGKSKRGLGADDDPDGFNADAARLQADREARTSDNHA